MKYFLDFDGVIFNINAFKEKLAQVGLSDAPRTAELFEQIKSRDPLFDLRDYVFADARDFITQHAEHCMVVSSYISINPLYNQDEEQARLFQEAKIKKAGVTDLIPQEHVYVVGYSKADKLAQLWRECTQNNEQCLFIDDRLKHIEEAQKLGIEVRLMVREQTGEVTTPHIHSFDEIMT